MIRTVIAVLYFAIILILLLPALLVEWIIGKANPRAKSVSCFWIVRNLVFKPILWLIGARVKVYGRENIPDDRTVVFMGNHRSFLDCVLLYPHFKDVCGFVAKIEIKKIPFVRFWMDNLHCLYFDRSDIREGLKMILAGIEHLKNGISICVMPEGTRSDTDEMLPFKEGTMKLATKSGCPIIPIAITNSASLFENHKPFVAPADITITFGKPIEVKELSREQQKNLGARVRGIIGEMLEGGPGYILESYEDSFAE